MTNPTEALAFERAERERAILSLAAGRELDAAVQRVVFGSLVEMDSDGPRYVTPGSSAWKGQRVPPYSSDPGAAILVCEQFGWFEIRAVRYDDEGRWGCTVMVGQPGQPGVSEHAETFPLAVCRAALLAKLAAP